MEIRVNRIHFPVSVLGPGRRVGIWFQGCDIGCPGCLSRDTWDPERVTPVSVSQVVESCRRISNGTLDGVTISGGEPFEQPDALCSLLDELHAWRATSGTPFDILCYSGRPLRHLRRHYPDILARLDALVPEPYVRSVPQRDAWRGSGNQPLVVLSALGQSRYGPDADTEGGRTPRVQLAVEGGRLWVIGLPRPEDLDEVRTALEARGVRLEQASWRL